MRLISLFLIPILFLTSCAHKDKPVDPYEGFNRKIHGFNMAIDKALVKPTAKFYKKIVPNRLRKSINNFYCNLDMIPTVVNDLLQGQVKCAYLDTWRLFINSTLGAGGLMDIASDMSLPPHSNDLGLTFAKWGYKRSAYLVVPFLGPSTIRDGGGMLIQFALYSPYVYIPYDAAIYSLLGLRYIDLRAQFLDTDELMGEAFDQYSFIRDAYLQHRNSMITGNAVEDGGDLYVDDAGAEAAGSSGAPGDGYVDE